MSFLVSESIEAGACRQHMATRLLFLPRRACYTLGIHNHVHKAVGALKKHHFIRRMEGFASQGGLHVLAQVYRMQLLLIGSTLAAVSTMLCMAGSSE